MSNEILALREHLVAEKAGGEMLMGKENRPGVVALTCIFWWSCRESNSAHKSS
jgi:hypothetical protein